MKKRLKIVICVVLCLAASWLAEQGLRAFVPDSAWQRCQKACQALAQKGDVHVLVSGDDWRDAGRFWESIEWTELANAAWVKEDKELHQLIFFVDCGNNGHSPNQHITMEWTFQFDTEGQLVGVGYLRTWYESTKIDPEHIDRTQSSYLLIHCLDRWTCQNGG